MSTRKPPVFSNMKYLRMELVIILLSLILTAFSCGFYLGRSSVQGTVVESLRNDAAPENAADIPQEETGPAALQVVNLNTADAAELDILPGIGPALAADIVSYREANGPFASEEDLMQVPGIGEKKFEELKYWITVR